MSNDPSLNPTAAHNALGACIALYAGIIADYERHLSLARAQHERQAAAHADQLREGRAENERLLAGSQEVRGLREALALSGARSDALEKVIAALAKTPAREITQAWLDSLFVEHGLPRVVTL